MDQPGNGYRSPVPEDEMTVDAKADAKSGGPIEPWRVLVVDDERDVHEVTDMALRRFTLDGRPLELLHAYDGAQARDLLQRRSDIALMLLDVVMETERSGLDLVRWCREELGNRFVRIVLRTGQPGQAPEWEVIVDYDINDYREKTELDRKRLYTVMISALRGYRDIMAVEQARQVQHLYRKRLELAIDAMNMLVWEVPRGAAQVSWSGDPARVLGIDASRLETFEAWRERLHPEERERVVHQHQELARGNLPSLNLDYSLRRDDGTYIMVCVDAFRVREAAGDPAQKRVIGVARNVTAERSAQAEQARLQIRLRQAEKLEAIGGLAGGIAHDFNNILGAMLGYAEMLQTPFKPGTRERKYADTIVSAGERGKALVAQILAFSRSSDAAKHPVDLAPLVTEVVTTLRGSLPANVRVVESIPGSPVLTRGNATHLYQLVMNLCTNAAQAMPAGGELKVTVDFVDNARECVLRGGILSKGRHVTLQVADQGLGIDEATMEKIFEPFFSTKGVGKGTGLGLAIAYGVAMSHGGAIDVESAPGSGTRFTVYLPECEERRAEPRAPEDPSRGGGEVILVVDDEPALVELLLDQLESLGYQGVGFNSSEQALREISANPDRFSAVITDEVMPGLTGTRLTAQLRAEGLSLPILVASGYGGPGFDDRAASAGATEILRKPYVKRELAAALARSLGRRQ
jgi:signal transduction histidine kinase/DNA-binding response OmpR family regulator